MEANISIREATIDDLDTILEWRMNEMQVVFDVSKEEAYALYPANKRYYEENLPCGNHVHCFACIDGEPIACAGVCFTEEIPSPDNPTGKNAHIMNGYTLPEHRKKGAIWLLMDYIMDLAKKRECGKITLETVPMARHIHDAKGFVPFEDLLIYKEED